MALNGANIDTATEFFPSENRRDRESLESRYMYQLLLTHLPVARTIVAGVDLTTIAADGAGRISVMKRILPWKYSDCSPGCVLAMEVHLDCNVKFYWLCF